MIPEEYQKYEKVVTVACVNFTPVVGDIDATLEKMKGNIKEAAAQGCNIIAFGEEALHGAGFCEGCASEQGPCQRHREIAETVPGPSTQEIARLAKEHDVYVVLGMQEQDKENPKILYNAVAVVAPEGILGTYRKAHLGTLPWITEGISFKPGNKLPVWETRYGPIGVLICYDFWFNPELSRILALKGARLIINCCGTVAGPGKRDYMVHITSTRAAENLIYTASANLVGPPKDTSSYAGAKLTSGPFRGGGHLSGAQHHCRPCHSQV
ncbi:carbon-nitrogen hydrolase family protein [Chloroflexota bacterium]